MTIQPNGICTTQNPSRRMRRKRFSEEISKVGDVSRGRPNTPFSICLIMQDAPKAAWSIPYVSVAFFPILKHNFIAYRSSKVSSRPDCIFEIHLLWQSDFSRVYSNCCCSCSFKLEIINIGQSSYKMYSNNVVKSHPIRCIAIT